MSGRDECAIVRVVADACIEVRDLVVVRGRRRVLDGLTLDLPAHEITGLLGPSGGSKSTLTRAIVGVQEVVSGQVRVLGLPAGDPGLRGRVGYQTQAPSVYADLTVARNLTFFAQILGLPQSSRPLSVETAEGGNNRHLPRSRLPSRCSSPLPNTLRR